MCLAAGLGMRQGAGSGHWQGLVGLGRALCHLGGWWLGTWQPPLLPTHRCQAGIGAARGRGTLMGSLGAEWGPGDQAGRSPRKGEGPVVAWLRGGELWGLRGRVQRQLSKCRGRGTGSSVSGFLLKGQVEGVPPAALRFLDGRGDPLPLLLPCQARLLSTASPLSPASRLSLRAGRPPPHHAWCLPFCGLLGTAPPGLSSLI